MSNNHKIVITMLLSMMLCMPLTTQAAENALPSYQQQRDQMLEKGKKSSKPSKFSDEDKKIMKQAGENLAITLPNPGLKLGSAAPDFTLKNAFGKTVTLSKELKKGPVVLVFYRGAWCPFCNLHLHALQKSLPAIEKHNAQIIAVTPQQPDKSAEQVKKDKYPFEILSDLDSNVMKAYGLYYKLEPKLVEVYRNHGLDVEAFNGKGRNELPVPGTFIIDSKGIVRGVHADVDYKERMEPATIIDILKKL